MRRRLMVALTLVIATVVVVIIVPSALLVRRAARAEAQARIQRLAERVADLANSDLDRGRLDAQRIERVLPAETYAVITIGNGPSFSVGDRPAGAFLKSSVSEDQVHVVIQADDSPVNQRARTSLLLLGGGGLVGVLGGALLAITQARRLSRPFSELAGAAHRLGTGDFSVTAPRSGVEELDEIAAALDTSANRIGSLVDAERRFNTHASHQLRTNITVLRLRLEELREMVDGDARAGVAEAIENTDQLTATVVELLNLSRHGRTGVAAPFDLAELVRQHVADATIRLRSTPRRCALHVSEPVRVNASQGGIGQAIDILLGNAITHGQGVIDVRVDVADGRAELWVSDNGPGIDPDRIDDLFRDRPIGSEHGVGLNLARGLVEAEGGGLELADASSASFRLHLPLFANP